MTTGAVIVVVISVIGMCIASWLVGYEEGREAALRKVMFMIEAMNDNEDGKHRLTHADLVQMETEQKNKETDNG